MHKENTELKKVFWLIISIVLLLIPTIFFGGETGIRPENIPESQGEYVLVVKGDHISLKARDASLKDILEEIGRRMKIEVVANISREEKITTELDMMYLEDAIKRFKTNYAYITKTEKQKGNITKIVVVPKGGEKMLPNKSDYNPQPPMQKLDYNPQPPVGESENNPQPPVGGSENNPQPPVGGSEYNPQFPVGGSENNPQPTDVGSEYNPQPPVGGSENNPQPTDVGSEYNPQPPVGGSEYNPQPPVGGSEYNPQPSIIEKK